MVIKYHNTAITSVSDLATFGMAIRIKNLNQSAIIMYMAIEIKQLDFT